VSVESELSRALVSADPEERRRAVARIPELPPSSRVAPLLSALGDEDWRVRKEAIGLSAELGPEPELLSALVDVFEPGDNVGLRNAAVEALGAFGSAAVDALAPRVPRLDADGKKLSIEALGRSGEASALDVLRPLVDDVDPNVRVAALEALGAIGGDRLEAARALLMSRLDESRPLETLAALESLACGTPAVVSRTSALGEIVTDDCGALADNNAEAIAEAVAGVVSRPEGHRRACARQRAEMFTWQRAAVGMLNTLGGVAVDDGADDNQHTA